MNQIDKKYILSLTKEYMEIPSVNGDTAAAMERIRRDFISLGITPNVTNKGALYGTLIGRDDEHHVLVNAHIDTLGAIVRELLPNGRLRLTQVGGYSWCTYEGENLTVHTAGGKTYTGTALYEKPSVHNFPDLARDAIRTDDNMEVRLDEDVRTDQDTAALGIAVGDFVSFDPRTIVLDNGYLKSRYIDDKACVAVMFAVLKHLAEHGVKPSRTVHFYVANYEEAGHGVSYIPPKTTEMLSVDIATVGIGHTSDERCVTICAKDSRTPYDLGFRRRLERLAKENGVDYRVDVFNRYGSDASLCVLRGADVNFACIGPGTDASHHYERTHVDALENTAKLLLAYLTN